MCPKCLVNSTVPTSGVPAVANVFGPNHHCCLHLSVLLASLVHKECSLVGEDISRNPEEFALDVCPTINLQEEPLEKNVAKQSAKEKSRVVVASGMYGDTETILVAKKRKTAPLQKNPNTRQQQAL